MIRVGCCGFSYEDWSGNFYPNHLQSIDFLEYYAKFFDSVEIESTFYSLPKYETIKRWYEITPDDFKFCLKMHRHITHDAMLQNVGEETNYFLSLVKQLKHKLGMVLIQFPDKFTIQYFDRLRHYISALPKDVPYAMEFDSLSWDDEAAFELLRGANISLAWRVRPNQFPPLGKTAKVAYIRFVGTKDEANSIDQNEKYLSIRKDLSRFGFDDIYIFVNNYFEGFSPASVVKIKEAFGIEHIPWPQQAQKNLAEFSV